MTNIMPTALGAALALLLALAPGAATAATAARVATTPPATTQADQAFARLADR